MDKTTGELTCKATQGGMWIVCPVCRRGKLLKLTEGTRAQGLVLFCRHCKHESVVEIEPRESGAHSLPRVRLTAGAWGIPHHRRCPEWDPVDRRGRLFRRLKNRRRG